LTQLTQQHGRYHSPEARWLHWVFLDLKHVNCTLFSSGVERNTLLLRCVPTESQEHVVQDMMTRCTESTDTFLCQQDCQLYWWK